MKNVSTCLDSEKKRKGQGNDSSQEPLRPSRKTILLLKMFARNYQAEASLPEGIQDMILS